MYREPHTETVTVNRTALRIVAQLAAREIEKRGTEGEGSILRRALATVNDARQAPPPPVSPARCDVHDSERHRAPCQERNGHANRETWAASLMLGNDSETAAHVMQITRAAYTAATVTEGLSSEHLPNVRRAAVADALEGFAADLLEVALGEDAPGPAPFDMATARAWVREVGSFWRVEWRDLARGYVATFDAEGEAARA